MSIRQFRLLGVLGEGSFSRVYKAVRLADSIIYAVKRVDLCRLSDSDQLNALNEVRILASVENQYVVRYREAFLEEKEAALYIVMEMAWGGDLKTRMTEMREHGQRFSEEEIWEFVEQIAKGLKALHDKNIIHCDLKSANIFLTGDGVCKIGDLNVSKVAKTGKIYNRTGTPYYAAPEVWHDQPYDEKSDIWSLGVVIYELATGKLPFEAVSASELYRLVQKGKFKTPMGLSEEFLKLLSLCLSVDPYIRPSCGEILANKKFNSLNQSTLFQAGRLLDTIRLDNLGTLKAKLPQPRYEQGQCPDKAQEKTPFVCKHSVMASSRIVLDHQGMVPEQRQPDRLLDPEDRARFPTRSDELGRYPVHPEGRVNYPTRA